MTDIEIAIAFTLVCSMIFSGFLCAMFIRAIRLFEMLEREAAQARKELAGHYHISPVFTPIDGQPRTLDSGPMYPWDAK